MANIYKVRPKYPCLGIFAFCIIIHLIVGLYGAIQWVWWPMAYGFIMVVVYVAAIVCVFLRLRLMFFIVGAIQGILLICTLLFCLFSLVILIWQMKETTDMLYHLFPQDGNYVETYRTLSIGLFVSMFLLVIINVVGAMALSYAFMYSRRYEDSQIVTRA